MNENIIEQQEEAAQINARFQENGISLEQRVLAAEETLCAIIEKFQLTEGIKKFRDAQKISLNKDI